MRASLVVGCEQDREMAREACRVLDRVYVGDACHLIQNRLIKERCFDYIILGDVLEHLQTPLDLLEVLASEYLAKDGRMILSVPNIQHIETFIKLYLHGVWPRDDRGLFDKTHLHQFTVKTLKDDLRASGLGIERLIRLYRFRNTVNSRFPRFSYRILTKLFSNLFTFQIVAVCARAGDRFSPESSPG